MDKQTFLTSIKGKIAIEQIPLMEEVGEEYAYDNWLRVEGDGNTIIGYEPYNYPYYIAISYLNLWNPPISQTAIYFVDDSFQFHNELPDDLCLTALSRLPYTSSLAKLILLGVGAAVVIGVALFGRKY